MENLNIKNSVNIKVEEILEPLIELKKDYIFLFNIDNIFSNETGGKTRLNRDLFNLTHKKIEKNILIIKNILNQSINICFDEFKEILEKLELFDSLNLKTFFIDDKILLNDLTSHLVNNGVKQKEIDTIINSLQNSIDLKNRLNNFLFYITLFDTSNFNKHIDKYSSEELINSSLIFDTINSYALLYEQLIRFETAIINFLENTFNNNKNLKHIENLFETLSKRADFYYYMDNRYKISLDYDLKIDYKKEINIPISWIENLIFNLIEQSILDTIKKDIKKGKTQKQISATVVLKKDTLNILVSNNGFEIGHIDDAFTLNSENVLIIESNNILNQFKNELQIESIESEGMRYSFSLPIN